MCSDPVKHSLLSKKKYMLLLFSSRFWSLDFPARVHAAAVYFSTFYKHVNLNLWSHFNRGVCTDHGNVCKLHLLCCPSLTMLISHATAPRPDTQEPFQPHFQSATATKCNCSVSLPTLFQVKKQRLWQQGGGSRNHTGKNKCLYAHLKGSEVGIHYLCSSDRGRLHGAVGLQPKPLTTCTSVCL